MILKFLSLSTAERLNLGTNDCPPNYHCQLGETVSHRRHAIFSGPQGRELTVQNVEPLIGPQTGGRTESFEKAQFI